MAFSGSYVDIDFILDKLHQDYPFDDIEYNDVAEDIWDAVSYVADADSFETVFAEVTIADFRGTLPVDFFSIVDGTVMEKDSNIPLTNSTDLMDRFSADTGMLADTDALKYTYRIAKGYIFTGIETGTVVVRYKAFPVNNGLPLVPDNAKAIRMVVDYIARKLAFKLMLSDKLSESKYDRILQKSGWSVASWSTSSKIPSVDAMERLKNVHLNILRNPDMFDTQFKYLGARSTASSVPIISSSSSTSSTSITDTYLSAVTVNSINDVDFTITGGTDILGVDFSHDHLGTYELALGNPSSDGYILSSTTTGVRTWIEMTAVGSDGVLSAVTVNAINDVDFTITDGTDILGVDFSHNHAGVYEPILGNPASDGYVLSSTSAGARSWVAMTSNSYLSAVTVNDINDVDFIITNGTNILGVDFSHSHIVSDITGFAAGVTAAETPHDDVVVDGDFISEGLIRRGAVSGTYTIVVDNSSNWNTAFTHSGIVIGNPHNVAWTELTGVRSGITLSGFSDDLVYDNYVSWNLRTDGVQRIAIVKDGILDIVGGDDISVAYGAGGVVTINSTFTETSHSDVVVDGDFTSEGLIKRGSTSGSYSILTGSGPITSIAAVLTNSATLIPTSSAVYNAIGAINHDTLTGFVPNEHIDWTGATQNFSTSGSITASSITLTTGAVNGYYLQSDASGNATWVEIVELWQLTGSVLSPVTSTNTLSIQSIQTTDGVTAGTGWTPTIQQHLTTKAYVDDLIIPVYYYGDTITTNTGTYVSGDIDSIQVDDDADAYIVDEATGTPGFDIEITFASVSHSINKISSWIWYEGSSAHVVNVQLYNYTTTTWDTMGQVTEGLTYSLQEWDITGTSSNYINASNVVRLRFYHSSPGNTSHTVYIDSASIQYIPISGGGGGTGTVTSVGLSMPTAIFDVTGSPITSSGILTVALDNQLANTVFSGPSSGAATTPTFRSLVVADIPTLTASKISDFSTAVGTYETPHATVLVDGDFATAGIMATDGAGTYSIITDNSSNWNTAYNHTTLTNNPHSTSLSNLTDTTISAIASGELIKWNGTAWINNTLSEAGIQPLDADLTAIAAIAGTSGLLKKTAANTWSLDTSTYLTSLAWSEITGTQSDISLSGFTNDLTYDNYISWNLKTNGVQRTTVVSGGTLDVVAGENVGVVYSAGGVVTISSSYTNTEYTAGNGISLSVGNEFSVSAGGDLTVTATGLTYTLPEATATTRGGIELFSNTDQSVAANAVSATALRTYGIQLNASGQAVVNVPWVNTDTNTQLSQEQVQDYAWNVLTGTQTLISVVYDDASNNVDFIVEDDLSLYDNAASGFISTETDPIFVGHTVYNIVNGTGFLKNNGAGSWSYDNSTYLTGNQTITLSGHIGGSGSTSISTALNVSAITDQTALTSGLISTDELLVNNGGLLNKMDISVLQTYMQDNLNFSSGGIIVDYQGEGRIPYVDSVGTDFDYIGTFVFTGTRLGVNKAVPGTTLDVAGSNGAPSSSSYATTLANSDLRVGVAGGTTTSIMFGINSYTAGWLQVQNDDNSEYSLALNPVGGHVGIGTLLPAAELEIYSTGESELLLNNDSSSSDAFIQFRDLGRVGHRSGVSAGLHFSYGESWGGAMYIGSYNHVSIGGVTNNSTYELYVFGDIYATGDMYADDFIQTSDPRFKDVESEVINGLEITNALRPVNFKWKDRRDNHSHIGFLTTDVEKVRPELVYKGDDSDYLSYTMISAINTAAIKELHQEIKELKLEIKKLKDASS